MVRQNEDDKVNVLSMDMILLKTKAETLDEVTHLNMWGNEFEDISILKYVPNVQVLSLSVNRIKSIEPIKHCLKLRELYLRQNLLEDLAEIASLRHIPTLQVLWLSENPAIKAVDPQIYRAFVIQTLPQLVRLDNKDISHAETALALKQQDPVLSDLLERAKIYDSLRIEQNQPIEPEIQEPEPNCDKKDKPKGSENITLAILSLLNELDRKSIKIVRRKCGEMLQEM